MITTIWIFVAVVLIHGFYRVGRHDGIRIASLGRAIPRVFYRTEIAPPHVKVSAGFDVAEPRFMRNPEEVAKQELIARIIEQCKDLMVVEAIDYPVKFRGEPGINYRATLRVIPPNGRLT
jgi:hypothetical protein